jgi:hypothetical protein
MNVQPQDLILQCPHGHGRLEQEGHRFLLQAGPGIAGNIDAGGRPGDFGYHPENEHLEVRAFACRQCGYVALFKLASS